MRMPTEQTLASRAAWLLAAALAVSACASSQTAAPARLELQPSGFTITQEAHVSAGVRADF